LPSSSNETSAGRRFRRFRRLTAETLTELDQLPGQIQLDQVLLDALQGVGHLDRLLPLDRAGDQCERDAARQALALERVDEMHRRDRRLARVRSEGHVARFFEHAIRRRAQEFAQVVRDDDRVIVGRDSVRGVHWSYSSLGHAPGPRVGRGALFSCTERSLS
jgi:hypothetical protein